MLTILAILHYILLRFGCVENVGKCPLLLALLFIKSAKCPNSVSQKKKISQQHQQRRRSEQLISRRQSMEEKVSNLQI